MSELSLQPPMDGMDRVQTRILVLSRAALEGERPLSDLLGEAFCELRAALAEMRRQETELRRQEETIAALREEVEAARRRATFSSTGSATVPARPSPARLPFAAAAADGGTRLPVKLFAPTEPLPAEALETALRSRIAAALYAGNLAAGDRLPSVRELARTTRLNHKVVRRVYRVLERAGLVEVRDRSGIYVADAESRSDDGADALGAWIADMVVEADEWGLPAGELPVLLQRSVGSRRLRCACVESAEDDRFALCAEISQRFGLETVPVGIESGRPEADLSDADIVVTTPFHASEVRRALAPGQPLVVSCLNPGMRAAVEARLDAGGTASIVCVDPASGERLRHSLRPDQAQRLRVMAVLDPSRGGPDGALLAGVATLAAWSVLGGGAQPVDLEVPPYLSPRTRRRLASLLVHLNTVALAG